MISDHAGLADFAAVFDPPSQAGLAQSAHAFARVPEGAAVLLAGRALGGEAQGFAALPHRNDFGPDVCRAPVTD